MDASTLAAWWGAATGTLAVAWEIFRWWRSGPRLRLMASPNMQIVTPGVGVNELLHVSVSVRNVGDAPTTLTHFCGELYTGWFNRLRRKREKVFVVTTGPESPIPHKLGGGETWSGLVQQDQLVFSSSTPSAMLYLGVQHSMSEKPALVRVRIPAGNG